MKNKGRELSDKEYRKMHTKRRGDEGMRVCNDLNEVRQEIDQIDSELIRLIAKRGIFVHQAAKFKQSNQDVEAPDRVEQVIRKVKTRALELNADDNVVEATYRAMISAFIEEERKEFVRLQKEEGIFNE